MDEETRDQFILRMQKDGLWTACSTFMDEVARQLMSEGYHTSEARKKAFEEAKKKFPRGQDVSVRDPGKFDKKVAGLPERASVTLEQNWIKNHPAMRRGTRAEDKSKDIILTLEDLKGAPSQWAVNQLQHWCNRTGEYFKTCLAEDRKQMANEKGSLSKDETDADLEPLQAMFKAWEREALQRAGRLPDAR